MHPDMVGAIQKAAGLSTRPACIVAAHARRPGNVITKENILDLLYAGMPDQPEMKIIDVFICKARAKPTPHGIEITTIWGRGYLMSAVSRLKLDLLIERTGLAPAVAA
jgi:two-component system cell cycle response regulator CtrA